MTTPFLLILPRLILSVAANGIQKLLATAKLPLLQLWMTTYALMVVPGALLAFDVPAPRSADFWRAIIAGGILDAAGNLAMVAALKATDLSIFGPLNGLRPVLALVFGWLMLSETPSAVGIAGVIVTLLGTTLLFERSPKLPAARVPSSASGSPPASTTPSATMVALRILGLSLSSIGAVYLKQAVSIGSARWTLAIWIDSGFLALLIAGLMRGEKVTKPPTELFKSHGLAIATHTVVFFTMQALTILIFRKTLLAYSFVYFQLAMALQVLIGHYVFKEPALGRRLFACVVIGCGSLLVAWKG